MIHLLLNEKELLFERASLQYEGRARLCRLASPRIPQVQVFGLVTCPYMMWLQELSRWL